MPSLLSTSRGITLLRWGSSNVPSPGINVGIETEKVNNTKQWLDLMVYFKPAMIDRYQNSSRS